MNDSKLFKDIIKDLRISRGLTLEKLAEDLNVNYQTIRGWERGVDIKLTNLIALSEYFDCDLDYLTGRMKEETHAIKTACDVTGLSEKAIKKIKHKGIQKVSTKALSHLIESRGFDQFMTAYTSFLDLLDRMKHISPDYGLWTSYRQRADGSVVMSDDEAVHHYMNKASMALSYICEETYNRKIKEKNLRPNSYDYEDMLSQIEANKQEIKYLQEENEYLKAQFDEPQDDPIV